MPLATESHETLGAAILTFDAQETVLLPATLEIVSELALPITRQRPTLIE